MTQAPRTLISPNYEPEKLDNPSVEDLIDVFEDRMKGWFFEPIKRLIGDMPPVAAIALSLSYYEGIAMYMAGEETKRGKSLAFFQRGFVDVFRPSKLPDRVLERIADVLYEDGRCGFFHDGMFRTRLYFGDHHKQPIVVTVPKDSNGDPDPEGEIETIVLDGPSYLEYLERHLEAYVKRLREPANAEERSRFETIAKLRCGIGERDRVIAL